jgi:DNA-binding response OmpR family regulator
MSINTSDRGRVLIVDDDRKILDLLVELLEIEGYEIATALDGLEAFDLAISFSPNVVVSDVVMPQIGGLELCRHLKEDPRTAYIPVLLISGRIPSNDAGIEGLHAGADDYLVKPFERKELLARIRALLRRRPPRGSASLQVGDLALNPDTREVRRGEREIELTNREFELLEYLMHNERLVVSRERLLDEVWGYDPMAATNTIDVFISNLRRKLEAGEETRLLHTKRGAGYVLKA